MDTLRPQSHGIGRVLFGMSPLTLREVPNAKICLSTGAVRLIADYPKCDPKKTYEVAPKKKIGLYIFERGTASDCFTSDYAPRAKTRTTTIEKRVFELGTSQRDCGLVPRSVWLIS